ncbi:hypothetical protein [Mesomycoplasma ovipneumoniae]|uniref:hypothetical protein n=1 Tax=Mesomycoplasma ovipneumoniae TaxID=29562 RepID=UPI00307FD7E3
MTNSKPTLKTRFRYIFLGKLPLERKYRPKIIEYFYLFIGNFVISTFWVLVLLAFGKYEWKISENWSLILSNEFSSYFWKFIISISITAWVVNIFLCIHLIYILSKTEDYKWVTFLSIFTNIFPFFSFFSLIISVFGFFKHKIVFK